MLGIPTIPYIVDIRKALGYKTNQYYKKCEVGTYACDIPNYGNRDFKLEKPSYPFPEEK